MVYVIFFFLNMYDDITGVIKILYGLKWTPFYEIEIRIEYQLLSRTQTWHGNRLIPPTTHQTLVIGREIVWTALLAPEVEHLTVDGGSDYSRELYPG